GAGVLIKFDREDWAFEQVFLAPVPSCFYLERGDRRGERYWGGNLRCAASFFHGRVNQELQPVFERSGLDTEHLVGVILIGRTQRDDAIEITMAQHGFDKDFELVAVGFGERWAIGCVACHLTWRRIGTIGGFILVLWLGIGLLCFRQARPRSRALLFRE